MLRAGEFGRVEEITGETAWVRRLAEMGLREGCKLQVLQPGSTCLLNVDGCRLCIRGHESSQILVQIQSPED
jgi:Fe2+ transport system protein FeoA